MAQTSLEGDKREREMIEDIVAKATRSMVDCTVEQKRRVVEEIDRLVSYEESTHAVASGQQH
jgi:hypothetical protein